MSIYQLKPRFQSLLRPAVKRMHVLGITANQVTLFTCAISLALGLWLFFAAPPAAAFAWISVWMLLRMVFNAVDGILAHEHGQQTHLGAFLNELTDVLSDAALYLPFALVAPFSAFWVGTVIVLAGMSEFAGALGATIGATRRYDGPLGKSDRAFVFGLLALYIATGAALPGWTSWLMPLLAGLTAWTITNRIRLAIAEATVRQAATTSKV